MAAEKIPGWIERLLLPRLNTIEGELKSINTRIGSLDDKIDSLRNETKTEIQSLRNETKSEIQNLRKEIESSRTEMISKFEGLDYRFEAINIRLDSIEKRIPVIEELTALKIKIADIEKRMAAA